MIHLRHFVASAGQVPALVRGVLPRKRESTKQKVFVFSCFRGGRTVVAATIMVFLASAAFAGDKYALVISGASGGDVYAQKYQTWRVTFTHLLREKRRQRLKLGNGSVEQHARGDGHGGELQGAGSCTNIQLPGSFARGPKVACHTHAGGNVLRRLDDRRLHRQFHWLGALGRPLPASGTMLLEYFPAVVIEVIALLRPELPHRPG